MGHVQNLAKSNLKEFWKYVNSNRRSYSLPCTMSLNDKLGSENSEIAELFGDHFKKVYKASYNNPLPRLHSDYSISVNFSIVDVIQALKNSKSSYRCSYDNIPAILLKKCT